MNSLQGRKENNEELYLESWRALSNVLNTSQHRRLIEQFVDLFIRSSKKQANK